MSYIDEIIVSKINSDKEIPYDLLLEADPSRELVDSYVRKGTVFVGRINEEIIGVYVLINTSTKTVEIVNIAVKEAYRGKNIGKYLLNDAIQRAREYDAKQVEIGTGNSSINQLALYQKCGFRITGIDKDFFKKNYAEKIMENGIQCVDMIRLSMDLIRGGEYMNRFDDLIEEVKSRYFTARKSHDWEHTERVYNLSMHIGKIENADLEVLKISASLHDIGREMQDKSEGKHCHAEAGAILAKEMLEKYEYPSEFVDRVIHCIETHRFRGEKVPNSLEAKILFDADKLDAIGAIGIGRAFVFAGEVGAKVHNKNVDIHNTKPYTEEDTAYREFMVKLKKVKDRMLTNEGRRIASDRHSFMVDFFNRLNKEVDGNC